MAASSSWLKLSSLRPFCFFIVLALVVLLVLGLLIPLWIKKVHGIEREVKSIAGDVHQKLLLQVEKTASMLAPLNQSAIDLARHLSSFLGRSELKFSAIESKVAPALFQALSTIPHLSQISFIALNGLLFSYYTKGNQHCAVYSNTSLPTFSFAATNYTWYTQPVNCDTGKLYGEAKQISPRRVLDADWFLEALKSENGHASVGIAWENDQDPLILNTISIGRPGALSLGFPAKSLTDFFNDASVYRGGLYLASNDGTVFTQGISNTRMVLTGNSVSFQLLNPNGDQIGLVGNLTCCPNDGTSRASILEIRKMKYLFQCSPLEIVGVQSVFVLALPSTTGGLENFIHHNIKSALVLLIVLVITMVLSLFTFVFLMVRAARREMHLRATLIKQMEATQQAERKSMNTSLAYASASHDVRAALAGIFGLIEMCREEVPPGSELETNLRQTVACTKDLLGILNSILDTSKIEAGRVQLEEEEFDLVQVVEDAVDLFHPVGMKKGVDVVLDIRDGSVTKFSQVKGDRGKLKQILSNLLSNAVKFTSEGHVSVRVWAKKPTQENPMLASSRSNSMSSCLSYLLFRKDATYKDLAVMDNAQQDQNRMEFIFEVNDTGKGIPKEKQNVVFENYVQVKEGASEQEGTGLGLGIVQSLVRLMGGEIAIVDKELGEKGTCFRFNTFLTVCGTETSGHSGEDDVESSGGYPSSDFSYQQSGQRTRTRSPKAEGSHVILLISSEERRKILQKFMQRHGIQVSVVKKYQQLPPILKKIKEKLFLAHPSTSIIHDRVSSFVSGNSSSTQKKVPLSALDGADDVPSLQKRKNSKITSNFVLIIIDTSAGPFREVSRAVAEFRRDLSPTLSRVVWIDRPGARSMNVQQGLDTDKLPSMDLIISKPLHGSRLYKLIGLLPEFGGTLTEQKTEEEITTSHAREVPTESITIASKWLLSTSTNPSAENLPTPDSEIQEIDNRPLSGKKVLVAEDNPVLRRIAVALVSRLGADTHQCQDGEEALGLVLQNLNDQREHRARYDLPFDYILMDCEMPVLNGYEATRRIREEERVLGLHIPIIALTAHTADEANKMNEAGMDYHLCKPLKEDQLLKAILHIQNK